MAITKEKKREIVVQYGEWLQKSRAIVFTEYAGMKMKNLDELRARVREAGGEFHIVKNTLLQRVLDEAGMEIKDENFVNTLAVGFAFEDAPALAKVLTDYARETGLLAVKAGYLGTRLMNADDVTTLANVPPLPIMRATLLSTILAPASQLVRTLSEPGRQIAAVLKAYADADAAPEAA